MHLTQDRDKWQTCEHGNELSGSMGGGEFLEKLSDYTLIRAVV